MLLIRKINTGEYPAALSLVWSVFLQFEAPDYPARGSGAFKAAITDRAYLSTLEMWGAYLENSLIGVIALRSHGSHIALFFVDGAYHQRGVGRALFNTALQNSSAKKITVNSSHYAIDIYRHLGFVPLGPEQSAAGLRYMPMTYTRPT